MGSLLPPIWDDERELSSGAVPPAVENIFRITLTFAFDDRHSVVADPTDYRINLQTLRLFRIPRFSALLQT